MPSVVPTVQLQLLGQFELKVGREVRTPLLTYDKPRLMLAMLALASGAPIARARMVALLWPDLSESQGKTRMRHALHVLRQALAPHSDVLIVHSDRLAINAADLRVDVSAMLAEGDAAIEDEMCLAIYRGALLDDLRSRIEGPLDEWFEHWRQRLGLRLDQCRARLISGWLSKNQLRDALRYARHWIAVWPSEESCYRILIDVLVRTGRYDEARKVYGQCKAALASMLAITPDPALEALIASLPLPHALSVDVVADGALPRYQPLAVLAIALTWRIDSAAVLADSDALEKLDRICAAIRRCVQAHGGWFAPGAGNQFVVYLGYPGASAAPVRRAADVAHALRQWTLPAGLTMQIGLHAALALCSPSGARPDNGYLLAQTALALAARAQPGELLISSQAHCRIDEYDVNEIQRDGQSCLLLGERRALGVPRIFGRTIEFSALVSAWRECVAQRVSLSMNLIGEAGYGKSLLAASLAAQARQVGAKVIWLKCVQDLRDQPLHPLRLWLLDRLSGHLDYTDDDAIAGAFGLTVQNARELVSFLKLGMEATSADVTPEILQIVGRAIAGDASKTSALLLVLDDAQWADPVTQQWIDMLSAGQTLRPMMILATRLPNGAHVFTQARIDLASLDDAAVASLVSHHARPLKLGRDVQSEIVRLADGNPQLITMMLAQAVSKKDIERPDRLRDRLCAQLFDLDAPTRHVLYLCAMAGAPLSPEQVADLLQYDPQTVLNSAAMLRAAGLLVGCSQSLQCAVVVAHAIVDVIVPSQSVRLSQQIAQYLLDQDQPRVRVAPFLEQAGDPRAPLWWKGAALDALRNGSLQEAAYLVVHALRCKDAITDEPTREKFVFDCQLLRATIASSLSGPAHPEASTPLRLAADMRRVGDVHTTVVALWAKWTAAQHTGSHVEALRLAQQLLHTAISLQDSTQHGWAAYAIAQHYLWRGLGGDAESLLSQAETLLEDAPAMVGSPFGDHSYALIPASLGMAYGLQGKYKQAFLSVERAVSTAVANHAWVIVLISQLVHARIHYLKGDLDQAAEVGSFIMSRAGAMSELSAWHAIATGYAMLPRVLISRDAAALDMMETALPIIRTGMPVSVDGHLCLLARARIAMNDLHGALALLDEAQALGAAHGSHSLVSEIHCLRGDIWALSGDDSRAQDHWRQARTVAEVMGHVPYVQWANERLLDELAHRTKPSVVLASNSR